jgi:VanZ family protein
VNSCRLIASRLVAVLAALYWMAMFAGTHAPPSDAPGIEIWDKALHFCGYAGLAFLLSWCWAVRRPLTLKRCLIVLAVLALYGAIDEISQMPVGRDCELGDWLADILGAACGIFVLRLAAAVLRKCFP